MKKQGTKSKSTQKIEQDKLFQNFNFWSKFNTKIKFNEGQSQVVQGQVNCYMVQVGFGFPSRVTDQATEPLTSSYNVVLTRIKAYMADDMSCLCVADVDRTMSACHHQEFLVHGDAHWHVVARQKPWQRVKARVRSYVGQILELRRLANDKVFVAAHMPKR